MNKNNLHKELHNLIDLAEKWGVEDDGFRDEKVANATDEDLDILVKSINENNVKILDEWFCDEEQIKKMSKEYIVFSCFFMAYEYAKLVLNDRNSVSI